MRHASFPHEQTAKNFGEMHSMYADVPDTELACCREQGRAILHLFSLGSMVYSR